MAERDTRFTEKLTPEKLTAEQLTLERRYTTKDFTALTPTSSASRPR
jgi:hypothetical protein